jgi:hypothetical protein
VTQLYFDAALTTPVSITAGNYKFRRPGIIQEQNKDGAYLADFDSSGLRTSISVCCLF